MSESLTLTSAEQTEAAGAALARSLQSLQPAGLCICLEGELGAGKTTFARGFMRGFGYAGRVPSPTYTLVEPYDCTPWQIFHLDLYRLQDGAELEYLGITEMTGDDCILLVEWPSRAAESLPAKDIEVILKVVSEGRSLELQAYSPPGRELLALFAETVAAGIR